MVLGLVVRAGSDAVVAWRSKSMVSVAIPVCSRPHAQESSMGAAFEQI